MMAQKEIEVLEVTDRAINAIALPEGYDPTYGYARPLSCVIQQPLCRTRWPWNF